jgi:hypothetical protein
MTNIPKGVWEDRYPDNLIQNIIKQSALRLDALRVAEKFSGTRAQAESLASMVIEWVDAGRGRGDWRPGLADVIEKRLARFPAACKAEIESRIQENRSAERILSTRE